ncbi:MULTISPECIES: holo-ACP synthase [Gracilibacillus]|uniref:Holo-[acyl-carrier-protein] synthase n=1 Tax=Gracilibacillus dipsosauri TaxID=178340 RepID=A0A317KX24_9BACI|nr:holo-ACP synthase [Gracilibacillus dipsosauri]PWU68061.1 holo-ACP synthase [Gracilibacillus dipsosauri]
MIKGIGIDIVELDRIREMATKQPRFISRILTKKERDLYENLSSDKRKIEFLAGRFAAKEAFSKAIGTGIGKVSFQDIEILTNLEGAPIFYSNITEKDKIFVSISHSKAYATAQVIIEADSAY